MAEESNIVKLHIAKGGKNCFLEVDVMEVYNSLPGDRVLELVAIALEVIGNKGMSSAKDYPAPTKLDGQELEAAAAKAKAKAEQNLKDFAEGKLKPKAKKAKSELPKEVLTEAMNRARDIVKNELRRVGEKPSKWKASEISAFAKTLLDEHPEIVEAAKAEVAARAERVKAGIAGIDLSAVIKGQSAVVKARVEKAKAETEASKTLSATQAGLVKPRKPKAEARVN